MTGGGVGHKALGRTNVVRRQSPLAFGSLDLPTGTIRSRAAAQQFVGPYEIGTCGLIAECVGDARYLSVWF